MHDARRVGAFFSGLFLYFVAIAGATALAGYHFPKEIQIRLGGRGSLSVQIIEAALIALVVMLVALVWSFISLKPARKTRRLATSWFLSGVGTAWLAGLIIGAFYFALNPRRFQTWSDLLLSSDNAPLWGLMNIFGVLIGALLAVSLVRKLNPVAPRRYGLPLRTPSATTTSPA